MIIDGRSSNHTGALDYDVLIVGAGPAGITLALELSGQGLQIGLLESGGLGFDPDTQMLYDGPVTGNSDGVDLSAIRLRFFGGSTNHWGGRCVPLDPIDFARRPLTGLSGWPITYEEMGNFYTRAHPYLGIGRNEYDPLAIEGVDRDDLLLPDSDILRTVTIRQSDWQFGLEYETALAEATDIDLWLWTNVTGLDMDDDGVVRSVTTRTLDRVARQFSARYVVLACGAVENARQILDLNASTGARFGDTGGFVGQCYMDHPTAGAGFLWPEQPLEPQLYWTHTNDVDGTQIRLLWALQENVMERENLSNMQFYLIPMDPEQDPRNTAATEGWWALRNIAKMALGRDTGRITFSDAYCSAITNADVMAADALGLIGTGELAQRVLLKFETEQSPERNNAVTLTNDRDALGLRRAALNWAPSVRDRDAVLRTTELIGQAVGAAGFGRIELEDHFEEPYWGTTTSWHQIGTTRMAMNPDDGVVDPDCRLHGSDNLYLAGGSVMPTGGRANPTLTIVALSLRLADHLKQRIAS
ncbi:GMC oxidoreductase [Jannaschia sp. CCS1]|uniref:GMC oxidoreductase n=1 Tax=Jannaschia sp. (strain CCS1) TaxID=290400 RepID=UPI000053B3C6|nr:GMC family oxidoreductase [Jannaschia sp. CCS1]ABD57184.1 FAD dependent oxidoreductase [Jannaschia sp. CCS1]